MLNSISAQYICKNTKKYSEKWFYGWILFAGRTWFNLILYDRGMSWVPGDILKTEILNDLNDRDLNDRKSL